MNFKFSKRSKNRLATCDDKLRRLMKLALKRSPIDFTVLEGHRSTARQQQLFRQGSTKLDGINKLSKHQIEPSRAVDIAPYPIDWQDREKFIYLAGAVKACASELGIKIRWGGDWDNDGSFTDQSFHDLPHFELR